jgi:protein-export membrane protein SecD
MSTHLRWLVFIGLLVVFCGYVVAPAAWKGVTPDAEICEAYRRDPTTNTRGVRCDENVVIDLNNDRTPDFTLRISQNLGLDLVGGLRVLLRADIDTTTYAPEDLQSAMRETANNINRRVNGLGLTEATIQQQGTDLLMVELPGVRDREQAVNTIQQTALLEFVDFAGLGAVTRDYEGRSILTTEQLALAQQRGTGVDDVLLQRQRDPSGNPFNTVFTGAILSRASALLAPIQQGGLPVWHIAFEIKPEFQEAFANYTTSRTGEPMAIVLDGEVLSAPVIRQPLSDGGIITGDFDEVSAKRLALQLQSGALPIPLTVEGADEVGATLGQVSVERSIRAGLIGVFVVLTFMIVYYRVPGLAADLALVVFVLINLALFKLIPVTVTLPAITGFLISIGTAVDGNILIFERIKEELRAGKDLQAALDAGFHRAWTSIRDSNLSTIIIGLILFFFGQTPGASIVSGFAITLILGLLVNLFTAVIVTRTFLYLFAYMGRQTLATRQWLMGI